MEKLSSYLDFGKWFIWDSLLQWRKKTCLILISGILGTLLKMLIFGLVVLYAKHFSNDNPIILMGSILEPRSEDTLAILTLLVVALSGLSAFFTYHSRRTIIKISRVYEVFCAKRVLRLASKVVTTTTYKPQLSRLIRSDSRSAARMMKSLISIAPPSLAILISIGFLFYIAPGLTFVILLISCVLAYAQYHVSRRVASHSIEYEKLDPEAREEYNHFLSLYSTTEEHPEKQQVEDLYNNSAITKQLNAYVGLVSSVEVSSYISELFMMIILGFVIITLGLDIIEEKTGWESLLAYLLVLRFSMVNVQSVFKYITSVNRFYPQVSRYYKFLNYHS